ncbi:hypothetical protein CK203_095344 [Vitis vinifera]|uniref:Uncharacterized protein n=1 Tax=Vitis vinifera TaxID=29760 RepID=A0A438E6T8_VITVI|nr:hypothetical protein CK203_095344 [Vitis vinifera]
MRRRTIYVWGLAILCFVVLMIVTPAIPQSEAYHDFADQREFFGNSSSHFFCLAKSLQGELWGWTFFFIGVAAVGIGSSYYHLKPNDARLVWDRLPPCTGCGGERLMVIGFLMTFAHMHWSSFFLALPFPLMAILLPPMYTHSTFWLWAAGFYLLAKVEEAEDKPIYKWTHHIVSGHTLKHLCAAMVPVFLTLMLAKRVLRLRGKLLCLFTLATSLFHHLELS